MKTVRSILASLLNDDMTWRNEDKSRALVSQAESEIRAIVRAELVEELRGKKFSRSNFAIEAKEVVLWSDISGMEKEKV